MSDTAEQKRAQRSMIAGEIRRMNPRFADAEIESLDSTTADGQVVPALPEHREGDLLMLHLFSYSPVEGDVPDSGWVCSQSDEDDDGFLYTYIRAAKSSSEPSPDLRCGPPGVIEATAVRVRPAAGRAN